MATNALKKFESVVVKVKQMSTGAQKPFPVEWLPDCYGELAKEASEKTDVHIDHVSNSILTIASASIGNAYQIEIHPGFRQKAILWSANIGMSGVQKSVGADLGMAPLYAKESGWETLHKNMVAQYEEETATMDKKQPIPPRPHRKSFVLEDFTMEVIHIEHKHNPKGLFIFDDELSGMILSMNKYRAGNDEQTFMKLFDGAPAKINRVGKDPLFISKPAVSIHGNFTPDFLDELSKGRRSKNGFMQRFLYCWPDHTTLKKYNPKGISPIIRKQYHDALTSILDLQPPLDEEEDAPKINLHPEATEVYAEWYNTIVEQIMQLGNDMDFLRSCFSKFRGICARVALTLEVMKWSVNQSALQNISKETMVAACDIMLYYQQNTVKVYNEMQKVQHQMQEGSAESKQYKFEWEVLFDGAEEMSTTDLVNLMQRIHPTISDRTCRSYLKEQLKKVKHGVWRL